MEIDIRESENILVLKVSGGIYTDNLSELRDALNEAAKDYPDVDGMIVDITKINYFSSMLIGIFSQMSVFLKENDRFLRIVNTSRKVQKFIDILNLRNFLPLDFSINEALIKIKERKDNKK